MIKQNHTKNKMRQQHKTKGNKLQSHSDHRNQHKTNKNETTNTH